MSHKTTLWNAFILYCAVTVLKLPLENCRVVAVNKVMISPWNGAVCQCTRWALTQCTLVVVRRRDCWLFLLFCSSCFRYNSVLVLKLFMLAMIPVTTPFKAWVCGRSLRGIAGSNLGVANGCLSLVTVGSCEVDVCAWGWSIGQRSPAGCGVSECDHEASIIRRPWPTRDCCPKKKKRFMPYSDCAYVYINIRTVFGLVGV